MQTLSRLRWNDWFFLCVMIGGLVWLADTGPARTEWSGWLGWDGRDHLGAEYDSIARSIRSGRGFADPFQEPTGPTAWMPPALPYLLASLYWLTGDDRESVVAIVLAMQICVVFFTCAIVMGEARRCQVVWAGYIVIVIGLVACFQWLFRRTHDVWLNLLLVDLLWLGLVSRWQQPRRLIYWGSLGGVVALCSPVLGAAWALLTCWRWLSSNRKQLDFNERENRQKRLAAIAMVAGISILCVLPWTIRNRVVLGSWMPIKSNGMFELWQSQCLDDDGVLDWKTTSQHPWPNNGELRGEYKRRGEMAFIAHYGDIVKQDIAAQPLKFLDRIAGRGLAATVWYMPHDPGSIWPLWLQRLVFSLPFLSACYLLATQRRMSRQAAAAVALMAPALAAYILISYYDRYAAPLIGVKMILILHAWRGIATNRSARFTARVSQDVAAIKTAL